MKSRAAGKDPKPVEPVIPICNPSDDQLIYDALRTMLARNQATLTKARAAHFTAADLYIPQLESLVAAWRERIKE